MPRPRFIIALVHLDMDGSVGDVIEAVGERSSVVATSAEAKRYGSLRRALSAAQGWAWYADVVRIMNVADQITRWR